MLQPESVISILWNVDCGLVYFYLVFITARFVLMKYILMLRGFGALICEMISVANQALFFSAFSDSVSFSSHG